jgi:ATP-dependent Lon protease
VDAKIEGAFERRVGRLLLPAENREDVERAERIPREVSRGLVVYVATLEDACRELFPGIG